ncbi:MAG: DMT family transporter [Pseudomonadota bacterium]
MTAAGPAAAEPATRPRAAVLMLFGVGLLSLQDSLVKYFAAETSLWQFQVLRSGFNLLLLGVMVAAMAAMARQRGQEHPGAALLWPRRRAPVALRTSFLTLCIVCYFAGAPVLTVAQMAAGLFTYPIFVTLLSRAVLGEPVGPWRLGAAGAGAVGALMILRPWDDAFTAWQLLPVMAGLLYACNVLTLRRACRDEHPMALAAAVAVAFLASGVVGAVTLSLLQPQIPHPGMRFLMTGWPVLTAVGVAFAMFASACNLFGNIALSRAYQSAEPAWLAPFDYSYLAYILGWGVVLFGDVPDALGLAGMALIAAAGAVTAIREGLRLPDIKRRGPIR